MALTFSQMQTAAQEILGDTSAGTQTLIKQYLNQANQLLHHELNRYWTRKQQTTSIIANQQYYQLPEDCQKITSLSATISSRTYPLEEVASERDWLWLNSTATNTGSIPIYYFVRGKDEFGVWPVPTANTTNGITLGYMPFEKDMTQSDFTAGTVTVTNGSTTITHSGTGFTQNMVGRYFQTTDNSDGIFYRISAFVSTSQLTLENYYEGIGGAGRTFLIGEMSELPGELHDSLVDYALFRLNQRRQDSASAGEFKALWDSAIESAKIRYANKTSNDVIRRRRRPINYLLANRDSLAS